MSKLKFIVSIMTLLVSIGNQAKSIEYIHTDKKCSDFVSALGTCDDIDTLFNLIGSSTDDSLWGETNAFLIPFKSKPCELKLILGARKDVNGVSNTTPLHVAVQGNNAGIVAVIFQKSSALGAAYLPFARSLANAYDSAGKKPIEYTTNPEIISILNFFTTP